MKKVLVVDDEEPILRVLVKYLAKRGINAHTTTEFHNAKCEISRNAYDLVLLDVNIDQLISRRNGLELLSYIRDASPHTKVIIMTGFGSDEIEQDAYNRGAYYYMEKPLDLFSLNEKLNEIGIYTH